MAEAPTGARPSERASSDRLDSWKEIAGYLNRDVTTVQRWEKKERMPVHRHLHDRVGSVYAFPRELDSWLHSRKLRVEEEAAELPADTKGERKTRISFRAGFLIILGVLGVVALMAGVHPLVRGRTGHASHPKITSLAVLPLKNLSEDPAEEYLADGMTEALIGRLAGIHDLRVISRTSVMRFKDTQLAVPEIARTLNVDAILEGSVIRQGSRLRVRAQLIRAATDEHFWSETYDRGLPDLLALQSDVAQAVAQRVAATVTAREHERLLAPHPVSPDAYGSYLKGLFEVRNANSRAANEESIRYFENAIQKDPAFAPAYLGLGTAHANLGLVLVGGVPDVERREANEAARKALELDPNLAEAHVLLGEIAQKQWRWAEAEAEYRRALELSPSDAGAYADLAQWLLCYDRKDEAIASAERARELDRLGDSVDRLAWILINARRYDDAIRELRPVIAVRPDDVHRLWTLGFALILAGRPQEAISTLETAAALSDRSPGVIDVLSVAYAHAGRRQDALRIVAELTRRKQAGYVPAASFVIASMGLGEYEQAFGWLEEAYKEQSNILQFVKVHPFFDPLRDDPRFKDLIHRVGLE